MQTIHKYPIEITDEQVIMMPVFAQLLCVQTQFGKPCIWARVQTENEMSPVHIHITGTGNPITHENAAYLGTFQTDNGFFVGHVFFN